MISAMAAAKAYAAAAQSHGLGQGVVAAEPGGNSPFAQMVQNAVEQTVHASRSAETKMAAHTQGKAELVDVVTSVASAEASLETAMAVRDQVISAYQEIMRMPI
jgi:flagellar hook-basal body complex protein FliE